MFLERSQVVFITVLFLICLIKCEASKRTQQDTWFKKLRQSQNASSSEPTEDFLKQFFPQMYKKKMQEGELPKQQKLFIKSRNLGGSDLAEMLDTEHQSCQLRPYVHFMQQPDITGDHFVFPFTILIPRCEGSCTAHPDIMTCVAKKRQAATFPAYKIFDQGGYRKRRSVDGSLNEDIQHVLRSKRSVDWMVQFNATVVFDTMCGAQCQESHKSCAAKNKVFQSDTCRCECKLVTWCSHPFEWNDDVCGCVCSYDQQIMTYNCHKNNGNRRYWNHRLCDCVCQRTNCQQADHVVHQSNCTCVKT